jgi:translation initiation factor IF-3
LRVIGASGENLGVISLVKALEAAQIAGLDLIEISPSALPPVARIADFGKYQYEQNKKLKAARARTHNVEVKSIQIKIGTGEHDLSLKAKKTSEWLAEGNRVKIELFLSGRAKYMELPFLKERLDRIFKLLTVEYKIAEEVKKGPKGLSAVIEKK